MAGRSQFTEENLARKKVNKGSPLKTAKRWQYENEDKNISDGEEQVPYMRNKKTQLILPTETDKEETEFKYSAVKNSERDIGPRGHKIIPKPIQESRDHHSSELSMPHPVNRVPVKPKV